MGVHRDAPLAHVFCGPAFQSLLSRPKASKFHFTSKATQGEAYTVEEERK